MAGQHALAGAAFTPQQDRGFAVGRLQGKIERPAHGRLGGLQVGLGDEIPDLLFEFINVRLQPAHVYAAVQYQTKLIGRVRLGEIVERATAHCFDGGGDSRIGRDDHDVQSRHQPQQRGQEIESLVPTQAEIQERHLKLPASEQLQRLSGIVRLGNLVIHGFEGDAQCLAQTRFVVNNYNIHGISTHFAVHRRQFLLVQIASQIQHCARDWTNAVIRCNG